MDARPRPKGGIGRRICAMETTNQEMERLYLAYHDKVFGYISSRIPQREDAEDLCAEVFLKIYGKLATYNSDFASLSTWIYAVTRNAVIDYFRTRRVHPELSEELSAPDDLEAEGIRRETLRELAAALSALPEQQRDIVILRYYEGLTLMEIAGRMGLSYGVVKLRHRDALKTLRKKLEKE